MDARKARVSIGLPVFNGENYLAEALDSLLAQTYQDFELIISDNGSTDRTQEIGRDYAAKDRRVRYHRNQTNLGAAKNYNLVFELSSGKYFKWAAHDDLCAPDFLEKSVIALDQNNAAVLSYSKTKHINEQGQVIQNYEINLRTDSTQPSERFHDLVCISHLCYQVFGLIRREALEKSSLIGGYVASDKVLLAQLGLLGQFYELPEYLLFVRRHAQQSVNANPVRRFRVLWFDPNQEGQIVLPDWRLFFEFCLSIKRAPISQQERIRCYLAMARWAADHWPNMAKDLALATDQGLKTLLRPKLNQKC